MILYKDYENRSPKVTQGPLAIKNDKKSNYLLKMIERYEHKWPTTNDIPSLYDKLHKEIFMFRESVHEILREMQPIKENLIQRIT